MTFGRWTVLKREYPNQGGQPMWLCQCCCKNKTISVVRGSALRQGTSKSCGCLSKEFLSEKSTTHGMYRTPLHSVWVSMKQRCQNPNMIHYDSYGGRGISVCKSWQNFENFYKDMHEGYSKGLEIDRIDNDGNYSKENCRWVSPKTNARNRRNNHLIDTPLGTMCIADAADCASLPYYVVSQRAARGVSKEKILAPVNRKFTHGAVKCGYKKIGE